jgi:hypothetical protein
VPSTPATAVARPEIQRARSATYPEIQQVQSAIYFRSEMPWNMDRLLWRIVAHGISYSQLHVEPHVPHRTAQVPLKALLEAVDHRSEVHEPLDRIQVVQVPERLRVDQLVEGTFEFCLADVASLHLG